MKNIVAAYMVTLAIVGTVALAYNVTPAKSDWTWTETITVNADGSISPPTAPIMSVDNITYTLTDNIVGHVPEASWALIVARSNARLDGGGYTLQSTSMELNSAGVLVHGANVTVQNMRIQNFDNGVLLYEHYHNSLITGNNITGNNVGIRLWMSSNATVFRNALAGNTFSLALDSYDPARPTHDNIICENDISALYCGIYLRYAQDNQFYHNTIEASIQVETSDSANFWDDGYPSGGNYWSYYNGTDADGDGVCDQPYVMDEYNQDRYPLAKPFGGPAGDVDGDSDVDIFDIVPIAGAYGSAYPDAKYNRLCDMDLDGDVDIFDLVAAAGHYGDSW
jgi:parallel beta-helix repeat protein